MSATAISFHDYTESLQSTVPDDLHPAGMATIRAWHAGGRGDEPTRHCSGLEREGHPDGTGIRQVVSRPGRARAAQARIDFAVRNGGRRG
jgi:hypothetical protein